MHLVGAVGQTQSALVGIGIGQWEIIADAACTVRSG
jgi:hypothetical protein